jgi:hypothetical protein
MTLKEGQVESHSSCARRLDQRLTTGRRYIAGDLARSLRRVARPALHDGEPDGDLWSIRPLRTELSHRHRRGGRWSPDGRSLFATSVLRGANGNPCSRR